MGVFSRFERKLEHGVGNAFARVFKGPVHPAEIARALQQDADANRTEIAKGRVLVPNRYVVRLGPSDYQNLYEWEKQLSRRLADMCREHFADEGWATYGAVKISFAEDESLRTGVFEIESGVDAASESLPPHSPLLSPRTPPPPPVVLPQQTRHLGTQAPPPPRRAEPSEARPALGHYVVIDGPNTRTRLQAGRNIIGRGSGAVIRVTDTGVSREHAEIETDGVLARIHDLQSTNGTLVNGRRVSTAPLRHGDVIRLGRSVLVYRYEAEDS